MVKNKIFLCVAGVLASVVVACAQQEGATPGRLMLALDAEQTGVLPSAEMKNFFYHGQKGEMITIKVKSTQFVPQVRLLGVQGESILEDNNSEGKPELEVPTTLTDEGDYMIQVRAKGAGLGAFQLTVSPGSAEEEKK